MKIIEIDAAKTIPIRHQILRPNQTLEECHYPNDEEASTFHLGVWDEGSLISIASFYEERNAEIYSKHQYRLRGMATLPSWRSKGAGSMLIEKAESIIIEKDANVLWCNAQTTAKPYYDKLSFQQVGDVFDISPIGPHVILFKKLC